MVGERAAQRLVGPRGAARLVGVSAEDGFRDQVEVGAEVLQHVRTTVDDRLQQRGEDAGAAVDRLVPLHLRGDGLEARQVGEPHRDQKAFRQHEAHGRQDRVVLVRQRNERGAEVDHAMIGDQAARRLDLAQRRHRGNAQAGAALDEGRLVLGRIEEVDPEDILRQRRRAAGADRAVVVAIDGQHAWTSYPASDPRCRDRARFRPMTEGVGCASDSADSLQSGARMDFALRENRGLGAEALDDRAHERPDAGRSDQHRRLALARGLLEALAHEL